MSESFADRPCCCVDACGVSLARRLSWCAWELRPGQGAARCLDWGLGRIGWFRVSQDELTAEVEEKSYLKAASGECSG